MAFPTVSDADTTSGTQATDSASWTVTYPGNIKGGDLLLLVAAIHGAADTPAVTGFTVLINGNNGSSGHLAILGKIAVGTESGTVAFTMTTESGAWRCLRIPGSTWYGGTLTAGTTTNASDGISAATGTGGPSTTPNPPSRTPAWGAAETLWIALEVACASGTSTASAYPASYTNTATAGAGGATGAAYGIARRELVTATEDPGTFTIPSAPWVAGTLAIRPSRVPYRNPMPPLIAQ